MRKATLVIASILVVSILVSVTIYSQTGGQQEKSETLKIRATEVVVDAVVVDHKNRLVTDLTPEDFEVYEDGVLQEVTSFRVIRGPAEKPPEKPAAGKPA